mgnify:CR=1 FL=1
MFALGIRYLNGFAAATEPNNPHRPEWPPHPGRVFMALAAAYFETGKSPKERAALEWLESLRPPHIYSPDCCVRAVVKHYVPVNDKSGDVHKPPKALLQSAPTLARERQPRTFARVWLQSETVYFVWPEADPGDYKQALSELCAKVTRIGHSMSLVQVWLCTNEEAQSIQVNWVPNEATAEVAFRVAVKGTLVDLERRFNEEQVEIFAALRVQAEDDSNKSGQKKARRRLKSEFNNQAPPRRRPVLTEFGYARVSREESSPSSLSGSVFEPNLFVWQLEHVDGPYRELDLLCTLAITTHWRKALIAMSNDYSPDVRSLVSGHGQDGHSLQSAHVAFLPLAFVGSPYADGHLLGVAIALPKDIESDTRRQFLKLFGQVNELQLGRLGKWRLVRKIGENLPQTLQTETWIASATGATHWSTVTPIAFDRHPKVSDPIAYRAECENMIKSACQTIGLPEPREVVVVSISAHLGVPPAFNFPRLQRKDGSERRHTHAILVFDKPVHGPVLIGAGRYRGYGFCKPLT